jgi:ribosomal 50S subunit-associated protein YjgA (DUF615 family)
MAAGDNNDFDTEEGLEAWEREDWLADHFRKHGWQEYEPEVLDKTALAEQFLQQVLPILARQHDEVKQTLLDQLALSTSLTTDKITEVARNLGDGLQRCRQLIYEEMRKAINVLGDTMDRLQQTARTHEQRLQALESMVVRLTGGGPDKP